MKLVNKKPEGVRESFFSDWREWCKKRISSPENFKLWNNQEAWGSELILEGVCYIMRYNRLWRIFDIWEKEYGPHAVIFNDDYTIIEIQDVSLLKECVPDIDLLQLQIAIDEFKIRKVMLA